MLFERKKKRLRKESIITDKGTSDFRFGMMVAVCDFMCIYFAVNDAHKIMFKNIKIIQDIIAVHLF